jgi:hypothetical protein
VARDRNKAGKGPAEIAIDRRAFLGSLGAGAAAAVTLGAAGLGGREGDVEAAEIGPLLGQDRNEASKEIRDNMAELAFDRSLPAHPDNGEEADHPSRIANFSKGLPHNSLGEVDLTAYEALLAALTSGAPADFEAIPLGGVRKLTNPQAGLGFDLEGPDGHQLAIRPAPRIDSPEGSAEIGELYWMALARDVAFTDFASSGIINEAISDLNSNFTEFRGPKERGRVTPGTIFRGNTPGDVKGPYLSQFLLKDVPYGALTISQRIQTVVPRQDYLTAYDDWLGAQNGGPAGKDRLAAVPRYIRTPRDLARWVHMDALYEGFLNACLILLGMGAPFDSGNPYNNSATQTGFGTFGGPHILGLVTEVATRALKAVWYEKWFVHRRLRPEALGGLIHHRLTGAAAYPVHHEILDSGVVNSTFSRYGTYLLPQAFPEGCPTHPSYGAGHATVAGACVTILKAWFDESFVIQDPVVPSAGGSALLPYKGADAGELTVGDELDKVAANIATGRNMAGIHYRSDYWESVQLGENVALGLLQEQKATYNEPATFTLTRFDGTTVTI